MTSDDGSIRGAEAPGAVHELQARLEALEKSMSTLLLRFGEQEQELINLAQIVMAIQERELEAAASAPPSPAAAASGTETAAAAPPARIPISPAMGNVLKLIHAGQAEEAKTALAAIPAAERNAQPAVLGITAAALCISRGDFANALTALGKARQLTDDPRMLRIVELIAQKIPAA